MSLAQRPFPTASDGSEQPDQTAALAGAWPEELETPVALDTLYVNAAMLLLAFGIRTGSPHYFEAALLITLLGFVATAALSTFLMRGEVIE